MATAEVDGAQGCDLAGGFATVNGIIDAQCAEAIRPPAAHRAVVEAGARRVFVGCEFDGSQIGTERDTCQRIAHLATAIATMVGVADAELAVPVVAPTFDGVIIQECAVAQRTRCDALDRPARTDINGEERIAHFAACITYSVCRPNAQLTEHVKTPADDCCVVEQCTGAAFAECQRSCGATGTEVDVWQCVTHFGAAVAPGVGVAEPELSCRIVSPALHEIRRRQDTRVVCPCIDFAGEHSGTQINRGQCI
jgi:hypothetical protein